MAWTFLDITRRRPYLKRRLLVAVVLVCCLNFVVQFVITIGFLNRYSTQRAVADYLRDHFKAASNAHIFCDEGTVQALSGIEAERFFTSSDAPKDREAFLKFLNEKSVNYLIVVETERATPIQLFPWSEYNERIGDYESILSAHTEFIRTNIHVYRRNLRSID